MSNLKKQMKKIRKEQERYAKLIKMEQSICSHTKKNGETRLERFVEDGVHKGRCNRCDAVVILDAELLAKDSLQMSADIVRTSLAEIRAAAVQGKIKLDDKTMHLMSEFDAEVLSDLPEIMSVMHKSKKSGKKNKKKNKKHKDNSRKRWV